MKRPLSTAAGPTFTAVLLGGGAALAGAGLGCGAGAAPQVQRVEPAQPQAPAFEGKTGALGEPAVGIRVSVPDRAGWRVAQVAPDTLTATHPRTGSAVRLGSWNSSRGPSLAPCLAWLESRVPAAERVSGGERLAFEQPQIGAARTELTATVGEADGAVAGVVTLVVALPDRCSVARFFTRAEGGASATVVAERLATVTELWARRTHLLRVDDRAGREPLP